MTKSQESQVKRYVDQCEKLLEDNYNQRSILADRTSKINGKIQQNHAVLSATANLIKTLGGIIPQNVADEIDKATNGE